MSQLNTRLDTHADILVPWLLFLEQQGNAGGGWGREGKGKEETTGEQTSYWTWLSSSAHSPSNQLWVNQSYWLLTNTLTFACTLHKHSLMQAHRHMLSSHQTHTITHSFAPWVLLSLRLQKECFCFKLAWGVRLVELWWGLAEGDHRKSSMIRKEGWETAVHFFGVCVRAGWCTASALVHPDQSPT